MVLLGGNGGDDYQDPSPILIVMHFKAPHPNHRCLAGAGLRRPGREDNVHPLSYEWELIGRPELSRTYIMNPNEEEPDLFIDVAGL